MGGMRRGLAQWAWTLRLQLGAHSRPKLMAGPPALAPGVLAAGGPFQGLDRVRAALVLAKKRALGGGRRLYLWKNFSTKCGVKILNRLLKNCDIGHPGAPIVNC